MAQKLHEDEKKLFWIPFQPGTEKKRRRRGTRTPRTGGGTPEGCYLDMLEKYGAKVDFLEVPAGALEILRRCYRLVHVVEILKNDRCTVKWTQGSSSFTTAEMKNLIDGIFDRLAEMGVNDPMVTAYWQEWKEP